MMAESKPFMNMFSANGIATGQAGIGVQFRGPEEFSPFVRQIRGAFPDMKVEIEDVFGAAAARKVGLPVTGKRRKGIPNEQSTNIPKWLEGNFKPSGKRRPYGPTP